MIMAKWPLGEHRPERTAGPFQALRYPASAGFQWITATGLVAASQDGSRSPSATITAGPVSQAWPASRVTVRSPPGTRMSHAPSPALLAAAAAAAATAPVP